MRPPFAYYGGKGRLAPWIVSLLPPHRVYAEPFAGSGAVLFAKPAATHEILNDLNGDIVTFFRILRDRPEDLERACRLTPYSREEFARADLTDPTIDDLERARRWWVRVSQSFAKNGATTTGWSTSIKRGSNNARSAWNHLDEFAQIADRLGWVTIENRDALQIIEEYSDHDGVLYVDPPYLGDTRTSYAGGRRPGGDYIHEFHTHDEHRQLADALHASPSTVILSGYPSELYDQDLYADWHRLQRRVLRRSSNGRSATNCHVEEVLWSNRPLDEGRLFTVGATT